MAGGDNQPKVMAGRCGGEDQPPAQDEPEEMAGGDNQPEVMAGHCGGEDQPPAQDEPKEMVGGDNQPEVMAGRRGGEDQPPAQDEPEETAGDDNQPEVMAGVVVVKTSLSGPKSSSQDPLLTSGVSSWSSLSSLPNRSPSPVNEDRGQRRRWR